MKISYVDFWPGFDPNCNWFNLLLKDTFGEIEIVSPEESDVTFCSCFGDKVHFIPRGIKKVLYIGENVSFGKFHHYDYGLTFDYDTFDGRVFRLPHWMLYINFWDEPNFPHAQISLDQLYRKWEPEEVRNRKEFCSIVIGNPVQNRIDIYKELSEYKQVHGYGKVFANSIDDKIKVLENYRFNICYENSIYPGYVTEKLLQAKVAGCIPIYYGHYNSAVKDFNPCFINAANFSTKELADLVEQVDNEPELFDELVNVPLFRKPVSLDPIKDFLRKILQ